MLPLPPQNIYPNEYYKYMTFIEQLAEEILKNHKNDLDRLCIVFPTRRAGLFLKKELAKRIENPVWSPTILSIQDFIETLSPYQIPDSLTLLFELFTVYQNYIPDEEFEKFYPWGVQVLNDFNEIDRSMVNAKHLFRRIIEVKEIEQEFQLGEEELGFLMDYWRTVSNKELTTVQQKFVSTWELLNKVYDDFNTVLLSQNRVYEGKAYRLIAENIIEYAAKKNWNKVLFAGFYALSRAEEMIINKLIKDGKAEVFLDADNYYLEDKKQEAGSFFRKDKSLPETFNWKGNHFETIPKEITIRSEERRVG